MRQHHVLITGATRGIGRACALKFAAQGWSVTGVARSAEALQLLAQDLPTGKFHPVPADLATLAGVATIPQRTYDVVVLNAATFAPGGLLGEEDVFSAMWTLNVQGNHLLARHLLPSLQQQQRGHLVVIGSLGTDDWPTHLTAYVATKYALRGMFYGWAAELASSGVLATLVAPGATLTSSWDGEKPPPNILAPERVADEVWLVVSQKIVGRVAISAD